MLTMADLDRIEELTMFRSDGDAKMIGELVKMARRYLWLRGRAHVQGYNLISFTYALGISHGSGPDVLQRIPEQQLDESIDSAINSQRKEGGEG